MFFNSFLTASLLKLRLNLSTVINTSYIPNICTWIQCYHHDSKVTPPYQSTICFLEEIIIKVQGIVSMTYLINTSSTAVKPTARALHDKIGGNVQI